MRSTLSYEEIRAEVLATERLLGLATDIDSKRYKELVSRARYYRGLLEERPEVHEQRNFWRAIKNADPAERIHLGRRLLLLRGGAA